MSVPGVLTGPGHTSLCPLFWDEKVRSSLPSGSRPVTVRGVGPVDEADAWYVVDVDRRSPFETGETLHLGHRDTRRKGRRTSRFAERDPDTPRTGLTGGVRCKGNDLVVVLTRVPKEND